MNRLLIRSDHITIRSDEYQRSARNSSAQTPSQLGARLTANGAAVAWFADRDLQALRPAELPLRQRPGPWSEAISGHQSARKTAPPRLHPERHARAGCQFDRQLQQAARGSQRNLCDQHGTPAPTRGSRVDRDGPGPHRRRHRQGRRGSRRHGCLLSCCWRLTIRSGERQ
jgi:hypothetical protein